MGPLLRGHGAGAIADVAPGRGGIARLAANFAAKTAWNLFYAHRSGRLNPSQPAAIYCRFFPRMFSFLIKIWGLARPYRGRMFLGVLTGIIAGIFEPLIIFTVAFVYGLIFPTAGSEFGEQLHKFHSIPSFVSGWLDAVRNSLAGGVQGHPAAVIVLLAMIPLVMLLSRLFSYLNVYLLQWVAIRAVTDLRIRLFAHLMNLSAGFFNSANSGKLISRISNDTTALQNVISNSTTIIIKEPATLAFTIFGLLFADWKLTAVSLVVLPLCIIPIAIFGRKVRRSAGDMQTHYAELTGVMSESFTGNRIIKAYGLESTVVAQFRNTAYKLVGHYMRIVRALEIPGPLTEVFGALGAAVMIFYMVITTHGKANPTNFIIVNGLFFTMYRPIKNLARLQNNLEQARAASARVFELLATHNTIPEPAKPKPLTAAGADIQFDNVSFSYDSKINLQEIQLTVKAGQMVALVGASGSGKTTITNLLLRFYDPQKGEVRIGGTDIREVSTHDLRNQIAVVTQETVLFNDTIRRNIELGRPGATNEEIEAAARHAHAHEFIMENPQGYDLVIGEKGVSLSGGQRQRIAIARAILRNAPILILDEATSALDSQSERAVQDALEVLMQGRTTICVAHRLSTIQKADVIVVLAQGLIVEAGRHIDLLGRNGAYRKLHEFQSEH
jgi:ATP-binding cassette, subfamily B, bacterial MsbA